MAAFHRQRAFARLLCLVRLARVVWSHVRDGRIGNFTQLVKRSPSARHRAWSGRLCHCLARRFFESTSLRSPRFGQRYRGSSRRSDFRLAGNSSHHFDIELDGSLAAILVSGAHLESRGEFSAPRSGSRSDLSLRPMAPPGGSHKRFAKPCQRLRKAPFLNLSPACSLLATH
jgi:hypothetical protein